MALLGTNIFFGINFTAVKYLFNSHLILPFALNWTRMLTTTALLWALYFFSSTKENIRPIDYIRLLICSLLGVVINQLLFIKGLSLTYSIHASLLMLVTPIFITVIAAVLLKERISVNKVLGLGLGITGATVLILAKKNAGTGADIVKGDLYVILNAIAYSFYFVLVQPLMKTYNALTVMRMLFSIGAIIALPFCWSEFTVIPWSQYTAIDFATLALICVCGTFFAYLFNIYGIKHLGPSISGSYIYTQPFFAAAIAFFILGETINLYKIISAILIFTGVYLTNKTPRHD